MAPAKFASMRYRSPPAMRMASFRDDTSLVGLRYEKTVAAEPPIRITTRTPLRAASTSRPSTSRPSTSAWPPPSTASSSLSSPSSPASPALSSSHGPVIVVAPLSPALPLPPAEQHPALRMRPAVALDDDTKRDSGHAPASPSTTIREEDCDDDDDFLYQKATALADLAAVSPVVQHVPNSPMLDQDDDSVYSGDDLPSAASPIAARSTTPQPADVRAGLSWLPPSSLPPRCQTSAAVRRPTPPRRVKSFSLRSVSMMRRQSLGEGSSSEVPQQLLQMRGFSTPAAAEQPPKQQDQPLKQPLESSPASPPKSASKTASRFWSRARPRRLSPQAPSDFQLFSPIAIAIPTDSLVDDDFIDGLSFSNRGSIMLGGQRAFALDGTMDLPRASADAGLDADDAAETISTPLPSPTVVAPPQEPIQASEVASEDPYPDAAAADATPRSLMAPPDIRVLPAEVDRESQKVRSLYEVGDALRWEDGAPPSVGERLEPTLESPAEEEENDVVRDLLSPAGGTPKSGSSSSQRRDSTRRESALVGGIEDWDDVDGSQVDRYGFISVPQPAARLGTPTELRSAQFSPRKKNVLQKRDPSVFSPVMSRAPSRKVSARSLNTQHSGMSTASMRSSRSVIRQAGNLLPHNRDRRWMDEAGDMLTVSPSLQDIDEEAKVEKISEALKRKEWERTEKWRKMAKSVKKGNQGEGMEFEFDPKNPKVVERTWKGIPDRWRSAAWWSFMAASAKSSKGSPTEEDIIADFHRLQETTSPDDVQIDLDVPRTISRHIMFRKRYRGGQRLLFRVLHAISIYYPQTGYVQGMASLAATLLCYFDEEKCFVMMVRMWQLRGLDRLYQPGFEGLLSALKEFDEVWLNKDVAEKLTELCIDNTAYGTRWYLTLFNLTIPFPAQLRVWDVFLLLGDGAPDAGEPSEQAKKPGASSSGASGSGLDVLHAAGAALIQALREVLLDSDFENAMKALTSWIPIKDEDMLMKVTKAEWKARQGKKRS